MVQSHKHKDTKHKDGVTVQELENFGKKHRLEVFFSLIFILSTVFSFILFGAGWSLCFAAVGGVLGVSFPAKVGKFVASGFHFAFSQEKATSLVLAGVACVVSIFLPPAAYFIIGLVAGRNFDRHAREAKHGGEEE